MAQAEAAIIDATLIESAARPRQYAALSATHVSEAVAWLSKLSIRLLVARRRATRTIPPFNYSADLDARWVKKGRKSTLGYKGFARCDEEWYIDKVDITPANAAESPQFETMIDGAKAQRVLADKAYASKANREMFKGKYRDGIMRKAARNEPLCKSEKRFNKLNHQNMISCQTILWPNEKALRSIPRQILRKRQNTGPNDYARHRR